MKCITWEGISIFFNWAFTSNSVIKALLGALVHNQCWLWHPIRYLAQKTKDAMNSKKPWLFIRPFLSSFDHCEAREVGARIIILDYSSTVNLNNYKQLSAHKPIEFLQKRQKPLPIVCSNRCSFHIRFFLFSFLLQFNNLVDIFKLTFLYYSFSFSVVTDVVIVIKVLSSKNGIGIVLCWYLYFDHHQQ